MEPEFKLILRWMGPHLLRRLEPQPNGVIASLSLATPRGSLDPEEKVLWPTCTILRPMGSWQQFVITLGLMVAMRLSRYEAFA